MSYLVINKRLGEVKKEEKMKKIENTRGAQRTRERERMGPEKLKTQKN